MGGLEIAMFLAGVVALVVGAEALVRGASRIAARLGIAPLVVGLTVVAYGTSAPEMAVSTQSAWVGQAALAVGNVVGSNIFNLLVILGASALIVPLVVDQQLVRREVPLLVGVSMVTWFFALDGDIGRLEGFLLLAGAVAYTAWMVRSARRERAAVRAEYEQAYGASGGWVLNAILVVFGIGLLVLGSSWLVDGAVTLAVTLGVSELVIGLTIVAAGTSLPELATSVVAAIRGERDIAVGNAVGSSLFNLLAVLGLTAAIAPGGVPVSPGAVSVDLPVMVGASVVCLPVLFTNHRVDRWEGALFVGLYAAYTTWLVLGATDHDALEEFGGAMASIVLPAVIMTLSLLAVRGLVRPRPS